MSTTPRKPRFLAGVPERPAPEAPRFSALPGGAGKAAPVAAPAPPACTDDASGPAPAPAPDALALRREAMARVEGALATLRAQADHLAEQARSDAIEIGFQVARKILEVQLHHDAEPLFALVRSAIRRAGESRRIVVRAAPEDVPLLESEAGRASAGGLSAVRIELVADASLRHGDCVVDADFGQVDGRLSTRLTEIRRAVDAAVEGAA
jgi:flagellar biosynthesis/type III secretory pathway protein FliH